MCWSQSRKEEGDGKWKISNLEISGKQHFCLKSCWFGFVGKWKPVADRIFRLLLLIIF
ncbi:hypothetical protein SLEP1_g29377 [Rubroshorea leprosula]|uniref:Uncharacterized protein n=1 Tax=Rubroshorea leprosula TaxID=152421 RepID=A0AAV5K5S1_9ROSI|nr:hypothetical protein SLEP1_g29377 [Rubroshorea leprosula]